MFSYPDRLTLENRTPIYYYTFLQLPSPTYYIMYDGQTFECIVKLMTTTNAGILWQLFRGGHS